MKVQVLSETSVKVTDAFKNGAMKAGAEGTALSYNKKLMSQGKSSKFP